MDRELLLMYIDLLRNQLNEAQWHLAMDETDKVFLWFKQIEGNAAKAAGNIDAAAVSAEAKEEAAWFRL